MFEIIINWKDSEKNVFTDIEYRNNKYEALALIQFEIKCEGTISAECKQLNIFEEGSFVK